MSEAKLLSRIRQKYADQSRRLWRNTVGCFKGAQGQWVQTGLVVGASDLIGYQSVEITQSHVGKRLAVFTAIEVKLPNGRLSKEQVDFLDTVKAAGGIAGVARSVEDAGEILNVREPE